MHIAWNQFTPYSALIGGALIGISAVILLFGLGRIAGVSGIVANLLKPEQQAKQDWHWQLSFVIGLLLASWLYLLISPQLRLPPLSLELDGNWFSLIVAGLLVGIGTVYGSGCTSGHGVCGISRLSLRSIAATLIFMMFGFLTVYVLRNIL
jgi:uncharacterized membrane protein YedE/YeeE